MKKLAVPLLLATLLLNVGIGGALAQAAKAPEPPPGAAQEQDSKPISAVEKRVFLDNHLANLAATTDVEYSFKRSGTLGDNFDDKVVLHVRDGGKEQGRVANADFLTGAHAIQLPEVTNAEGNPVLLYFLERDVREMEKATKGKRNFFQKRVRLALAEANAVKPVSVKFDGREIKAEEVRMQPYLNDPVVRQKAARWEGKTYVITLSDQVPGGVYQIRTTLADPAKAGETLVDETLTFAKLIRK